MTGADRRLGLEIAKGLAAAGALVLLNGRNRRNLEDAAATIVSRGGATACVPFDITDEAAVTAALDSIRDEYGRLDILVSNAGLRDRRSLFELELDAVRRLIEVDLVAPFNLSRAAAQIMTERGWGRIVNVTSLVAAPMACSERSTSPAVLAHEVLNTASPRHFVGISQHTPAGSSPPPLGARHQDPTFGVSTA